MVILENCGDTFCNNNLCFFFSIFVAMQLTLHKNECIQNGVYELYFQFARQNKKVTKLMYLKKQYTSQFFMYFSLF